MKKKPLYCYAPIGEMQLFDFEIIQLLNQENIWLCFKTSGEASLKM
jgi:hypothetical protein